MLHAVLQLLASERNLMIQAAIFDVDGMILDTREFIFQAYEFTLAEHGHDVPDRVVIAEQIGRSLPDCYEAFAPQGELDALCDTHHEFQDSKLHLITAYEGLLELFDTLRDAGIKLGAFSSRKGNLVPSLANAGVLDYFGVVVQGSDVVNHKPHPEGLLYALNALDVAPEHAVMLGDAAVDIEAGKAAEVALTIGITHGFGTRDALVTAGADFIVDDLHAIAPIILSKR